MAAVASLRLAATAPRARVAQERASPPRARRVATRPARHVALASSEETPADREDEDEEEVGMDDLVEVEMGGARAAADSLTWVRQDLELKCNAAGRLALVQPFPGAASWAREEQRWVPARA